VGDWRWSLSGLRNQQVGNWSPGVLIPMKHEQKSWDYNGINRLIPFIYYHLPTGGGFRNHPQLNNGSHETRELGCGQRSHKDRVW
jgi:hypothetical protein